MAQYTNITPEEISALFVVRPQKIDQTGPFPGGAENSTFKIIVDQIPFVLTVYEEKNFEEVHQITQLISFLSAEGLSGSTLLKLKEGPVGRIQGKPTIIKSYLEGEILEKLSAMQCRQLGKNIAQLHSISAPNYLPQQPNFGLSFMQSLIFNHHNTEFEAWLKRTITLLSKQPDFALPTGLIHADIFPDNLIFNAGELVAIIDFEDACIFPLVYDLAMAFVGCCRIDNKLSYKLVNALLTGYQELRELETEEINTLPYFVKYAAASTAAWRYWKQTQSVSGTQSSFDLMAMQSFIEDFSLRDNQEFLSQLKFCT
jgi:homoserine kinase type II